MKRTLLGFASAASCIFLLGGANAATARVQSKSMTSVAADIAAVRQVGRQWQSYYEAGRFEAIPELYTTDTMVMPRGRPRIEGREAMRRSLGGLAAGRKVNIQITEREIAAAGKFAWFVGDFIVTYTAKDANTPPKTEFGRSLILFRRDGDGKWRIHRDMDSPAPGPASLATPSAPSTLRFASAAAPSTNGFPPPRAWNSADRTEPTECDRLTASRYDRTRLAKPVAREEMDVPAAIRQCELDLARFPGDPRIHFQLGRIYGYAGNQAKTSEHRRAAAAAGNHNAIFLLGYLAWSAAKDDQSRCSAASEMRLAADRGNYSAQLTYASLFLEGKFSPCQDVASTEQVAGYVKAARPAVDGFFETRLADHLANEISRRGTTSGDEESRR